MAPDGQVAAHGQHGHGRTGLVGGLNVGREYLGRDPGFGYWRDTHLRVQGPAVADLQRVFAEDWDFAAGVAGLRRILDAFFEVPAVREVLR